MKQFNTAVILIIAVTLFASCSSAPKGSSSASDPRERFRDYLVPDPKADEVFRVLLTSDGYTVSQMKSQATIKRNEDPGGDMYMCDEMKRLDKIDEVREGIVSIWLYPDSGKIMKVRPQKPTYLLEIDKIITEDIQRWSFSFPKKYIEPTKLDIKFKVVLRKKQSDEEIMKEVQGKLRENQ